MRNTIKSVLRLYLVGMIWFAVMWGTSLGLLGLMGVIYSGADVSPVIQTTIIMGIAVSTATLVAWLAWMRLRERPEPEARRAAGDLGDRGRESSLVATRPRFG